MMRATDRMVAAAWIAIVTAVATIPSLSVSADDCPTLAGRWPFGPTLVSAVDGTMVYYGSGHTLMVADVSQPSDPRVIGSVTLPDKVRDIAIGDGVVFVAALEAGLRVIDARDPRSLREVASFEVAGDAMAVELSNGFAYVADSNFDSHGEVGYLRVIDIGNPERPIEVGCSQRLWYVLDVEISGHYAYLPLGSETGAAIIDISSSESPTLVSEDLPWATEIAVANGVAYLDEPFPHGPTLTIVDVTDPVSPSILGELELPFSESVWGIEVFEDRVFIVDRADGYGVEVSRLSVIDVLDPSAPALISMTELPLSGEGVTVDGNLVFLADPLAGLRLFDLTPVHHLSEIAWLPSPGTIRSIDVSGPLAYVLDDHAGLWVMDVSASAAPVTRGFAAIPGYKEAYGKVVVDGGLAYVADGEQGFYIVDVADPSTPEKVGFLEARQQALDVAVSGPFVYVADKGIRVIDVSVPSAPVEVEVLFPDEYFFEIAVAENVIFATQLRPQNNVDAGSRPFEFRPSPSLKETKPVVVFEEYSEIETAGDYLFLVRHPFCGLTVVDASVPVAPEVVAAFDEPEFAFCYIALDGDELWGAKFETISVLDVERPWEPTVLGSVSAPWWVMTISASAGQALLGNSSYGDGVWAYRSCRSPAPRGPGGGRLDPSLQCHGCDSLNSRQGFLVQK